MIHVTERWRDRATLAAHARSAHIVAWQAERTSLGFADRALTVYDVDDGRPA